MTVDALIVGQGLAGSVVAAQLMGRGWSVAVIDRDEEVTSSKVAAGLVTPITGNNLALSWRLDEFLPVARAFYEAAELATGSRFWFAQNTVRVLRGEDEVAAWERKRDDPAYAPYLARQWFGPEMAGAGIRAPFGGFEMTGGGWVDVRVFLKGMRRVLKSDSGFIGAEFDPADVELRDGGVRWGEVEAGVVVFCQGHEGGGNPFFDWVPFNSAKGEILDLAVRDFSQKRTVNAGGWVLPVGGGKFRAGSTYDHARLDTEPTPGGRRRIIRNVKRALDARFEVEGHVAAVRPIIRASQVLMGRHPTHDPVCFFNGLGSKGVLHAPFFAAQLADHLVSGAPIEEGADLRRNG